MAVVFDRLCRQGFCRRSRWLCTGGTGGQPAGLVDRHPPIVPAAFRKLDAVAVLAGPLLPAPGSWGWLDAMATLGSAPRGCPLSVVVADVVAEPPDSLEITGKPPVGKVCGRPRHVEVQW